MDALLSHFTNLTESTCDTRGCRLSPSSRQCRGGYPPRGWPDLGPATPWERQLCPPEASVRDVRGLGLTNLRKCVFSFLFLVSGQMIRRKLSKCLVQSGVYIHSVSLDQPSSLHCLGLPCNLRHINVSSLRIICTNPTRSLTIKWFIDRTELKI